jgi:Zn-dependent oligopeptidase
MHARERSQLGTRGLTPGGAAWLQNFSERLMNWDVSYFAQLQQQALFNLTDEEVRPYFVYDNVLQGLFQVSPSYRIK